MPRSRRLLTLLDLLRRRHGPVTAETLAQQLSVSTRTVYRDIAQNYARKAPTYAARPGWASYCIPIWGCRR